MKPFSPLQRLLEFLEDKLDEEALANARGRAVGCLEKGSPPVCVSQCLSSKAESPFHRLTLEEGARDFQVMLYNELCGLCGVILSRPMEAIPSIRPNYGTGILPSLFGSEIRYVDPNELPWSGPIGEKELAAFADQDTAPLDAGLGERVMETYDFFTCALSPYPKLSRCIHYAHADLQGPFDVLHLLYDNGIYFSLYDDPAFVHALLGTVTRTYIAFLKRMLPVVKSDLSGCCYHWNTIYPGLAVIRDDSAVTLGKEHYLEFSLPYIRRIIDALGGASVHYCGADTVWLPELIQTDGLCGLNFGYVESKKEQYGLSLLEKAAALRGERPLAFVSYPLSERDCAALSQRKDLCRITCSITG